MPINIGLKSGCWEVHPDSIRHGQHDAQSTTLEAYTAIAVSSLLTNLGLTANNSLAPLPNYGPHFLLGNFFLSYVLTTTRF
ncbi:hypothetical protein KCU77_g7840, partial [Aureobasidium melanogenum]